MSDKVTNLINELADKGWSSINVGSTLTFTRGDSVITGHQEYVTYSVGEVSISSKWASQFLTTMDRLDFLIREIRHFAEMDDSKIGVAQTRSTQEQRVSDEQLAEMKRHSHHHSELEIDLIADLQDARVEIARLESHIELIERKGYV